MLGRPHRHVALLATLACMSMNVGAIAQPANASDAEPATRQANAAVLQSLPFNDRTSFDDARRGLVAAPPELTIPGPNNRVAFTTKGFEFENADAAPPTVNPSLWRQSQLNAIYGLFKITDRVYQVRGYDLANTTIIEGDTGLIVIDTLATPETGHAALQLYQQYRPAKPINTVIYTHSHPDHYGGVRGFVSEDDVKTGKVKIIAPDKFLEPAVSENVLAGNALGRRRQYMFGFVIPRGEKGFVDEGLGKDYGRGVVSLYAPSDSIKEPYEKRRIDGIDIEFMLTPGTEAPSEMIMYLPQFRVLQMAEVTTQNMHNIYTLRGAEVRDANGWSKYINAALQRYGANTDIIVASHHWPTWGNARVQGYLKKQRDLYKYIHDQSVRLLNHGFVGAELSERLKLPKSLENEWSLRGYYGSLSHNARGIYQKYMGFYTSNPAELDPLPPTQAAKKWLEYLGGPDAVMRRARDDFQKGEYRWVAQVMNQVVYAYPENAEARNLEASALEQLAYQSESASWRNEYLAGAYELRNGRQQMPGVQAGSPDTIRALTLDLFFDYMGVRLNGPKAEGKTMVVNWRFSDTGQNYALNLENSALTYTPNATSDRADTTLTLARSTLDSILLRQTTFEQALSSGQIKAEGDAGKFAELLTLLDDFEPMFGIMTPDRGRP